MAENERCCERDMNLGLTGTTSFSHLLFSEDDSVGLFKCTTPSGFPADKLPKMLCFGDFPNKSDLLFSEKKSALTCTADSSSSSSSSASSSNSVVTTLSNSINRKRNGSGPESVQCTSTVAAAAAADQRTSKKIKPENPTSISPPKRKEKLGERIAALQQLVSPFGKTDTASVLHEAMGYIRFLQEQVQVLCSPYLLQQQQRFPSLPEKEGGENGEKEGRKDLRSRGLCLVPVDCTVHVANTNGADFWSPAMASKE